VEDDATLRALRSMDVDFAQGFGIARPAPLESAL
jgi:EAL domain-containing protein (putative c-di-GMP-specific phosphodiesterase class I)